MSKFRERWRDPTFILDVAQVIVASVVAIVLALDMTGIWSGIPWLSNNLTSLTFIAVCLLIVSSFLERQLFLERFAETTGRKLDKIIESDRLGIKLENREGFRVPLETRLANAQNVSLLGFSLVGILTHYEGLISRRALAGCKFRILIVDPNLLTVIGTDASRWKHLSLLRKRDLEYTISKLGLVLAMTKNIELRYCLWPPTYSLLMIDPEQHQGEIQVEMYTYQSDTSQDSTSERPHFVLTQSTDKQWYDFFKRQFEFAWEEARPHVVRREAIGNDSGGEISKSSEV